MPSLLDIRRRIRSVKNTQQITKAMKMVSAANIKRAQAFIRDNAGKEIELYAVGRKGRDFFRRRAVNIAAENVGMMGRRVGYEEAMALARDVMRRFVEDEGIDKVFLVYSEFRSVLSQRAVVEQILPVSRVEENADEAGEGGRAETFVDYIYEQPPEEIFSQLLPRLIETQVYRALLESVASEQGARMTAMDSASKNAGELIQTLTLNMNRIRQASITREIIEIVSGAAAL